MGRCLLTCKISCKTCSLLWQVFRCLVWDILRNKLALYQPWRCALQLSFSLRTVWQGQCQLCLGAKESTVCLSHPATSWQVWQISVLLFCRGTSVSPATAAGVMMPGFPYPEGDSGQLKCHAYFSHRGTVCGVQWTGKIASQRRGVPCLKCCPLCTDVSRIDAGRNTWKSEWLNSDFTEWIGEYL